MISPNYNMQKWHAASTHETSHLFEDLRIGGGINVEIPLFPVVSPLVSCGRACLLLQSAQRCLRFERNDDEIASVSRMRRACPFGEVDRAATKLPQSVADGIPIACFRHWWCDPRAIQQCCQLACVGWLCAR